MFVCEKCSKRVGADKHGGRHLAGALKRQLKSEFPKGDIRIAMTSCMDLCPKDAIAVTLQPVDPALPSMFWEVDAGEIQKGGEELARAISDRVRDRS